MPDLTSSACRWYTADKGEVHSRVIEYVREVERVQSDIFDRFVKLAWLYDPNDYFAGDQSERGPTAHVSRNVIASNVDTVAAVVSTTDVRARFMTDDADWSTQRTARHLEWYAEGLCKLLGVHECARRGFKDAALKGTGLAKVYIEPDTDEIRVERVVVDDIVVDEGECRGGAPRQMHQRVFVDREVLQARFPDHADEIERAQRTQGWQKWAGYRPIERDELVVIESWRLPIGKQGAKGYVSGRHTICIDGADLEDEDWDKPYFPFARFVWSERTLGWYGISLAERIAPHQRRLNKLNWQIDRQLDQHAVPTTYVRMADANLAVRDVNRAGTIVPIKADYPQTIIPPAVSAETYRREEAIAENSYEESGLSRLAATSRKPAGIESGVALREYRDQTTQRFALQEKAFEQFVLDIVWLVVSCAKELGAAKAPTILRKTKQGIKKVPWAKVDMGEVKVQIAPASTLSRTPAGRTQMVLEWAQAGVISQDEARRLMRHPDLERAMSLYTSALEDIERCIEDILDGEQLVPEPYQNLKLGLWRFQAAYLKACDDGAPEGIKESLRQWITQAAHIMSLAEQPVPAAPQMPGADPMADPMAAEAAMAGGVPPMGAPPMGPVPIPAIAPEAIGVPAA